MSDTVIDLRSHDHEHEKPATPNRNAREVGAAKTDSGTFLLQGKSAHDRRHGSPPVVEIVQPGQTFTCDGSEAAACRADPEKFKEL